MLDNYNQNYKTQDELCDLMCQHEESIKEIKNLQKVIEVATINQDKFELDQLKQKLKSRDLEFQDLVK